MDSFHNYLKKQLIEYVEAERKKGVPLEQIEQILLNAGHEKNIVQEVFEELKKEEIGKKTIHNNAVENDLVGMLKSAFSQFMAKASDKEIKSAKEDIKKTDTEKIVQEVIQEAEVIEEKTMLEGVVFFIYLVVISAIVLLSAASTDSEIVKVALGFAPAILCVFVSFIALPMADNVPVYVFIPVIISSIFYAVGKFSGVGVFTGLDVEALAIVNFLIAFIFNILIVYVRFLKPKSMKRRVIKKKTSEKTSNFIENQQYYASSEKKKEIQDLKKEFNL